MRKSKRTIRLLFFLIIALLITASVLDRLVIHKSSNAPQAQSSPSSNQDNQKYHLKQFTVSYVVDGDTLDLNVADDINQKKHTRVRLLGIDTPETKKPNSPIMYFGQDAFKKTKQLTLDKVVTVILDPLSKSRDRYGRLLCHIKLSDDTFLSQVLIEQGYCYVDPRFPHSFYRKYEKLGRQARRKKIGLWESVTPKDYPRWMKK